MCPSLKSSQLKIPVENIFYSKCSVFMLFQFKISGELPKKNIYIYEKLDTPLKEVVFNYENSTVMNYLKGTIIL